MLHANTDFIKLESPENITSNISNFYNTNNSTAGSDNVLINKGHCHPCVCLYCLSGLEK